MTTTIERADGQGAGDRFGPDNGKRWHAAMAEARRMGADPVQAEAIAAKSIATGVSAADLTRSLAQRGELDPAVTEWRDAVDRNEAARARTEAFMAEHGL